MRVNLHLGTTTGEHQMLVDGVDISKHVLRAGLLVALDEQGQPQIKLQLARPTTDVSMEVASILDLIDVQLQEAYERGWSDCANDHIDQRRDPAHLLGARHQQPYVPVGVRYPYAGGGHGDGPVIDE